MTQIQPLVGIGSADGFDLQYFLTWSARTPFCELKDFNFLQLSPTFGVEITIPSGHSTDKQLAHFCRSLQRLDFVSTLTTTCQGYNYGTVLPPVRIEILPILILSLERSLQSKMIP